MPRKNRRGFDGICLRPSGAAQPAAGCPFKRGIGRGTPDRRFTKNPDYCHLVLEKIQPEDFMTDFNREIFRVVCERLMENRSVELIALSEQLSEEQMGKVAGIMADPVSSRATPKEAQDYIEVILAGKKKKRRRNFGSWTAGSWNSMWQIWRQRRSNPLVLRDTAGEKAAGPFAPDSQQDIPGPLTGRGFRFGICCPPASRGGQARNFSRGEMGEQSYGSTGQKSVIKDLIELGKSKGS